MERKALSVSLNRRPRDYRRPLVGSSFLRFEKVRRTFRGECGERACASLIVRIPARWSAAPSTRASRPNGLEQEFNSLDAQREACEAYIVSQRHAGWTGVPEMYDDGGLSGG